jgi:hypothetical protein
MASDLEALSCKAWRIYAERLREKLEPDQRGEFVAIEPESGDYYLGRTISDAGQRASASHPDRLYHIIRVGSPAAIEIGGISSR